MHKKGCDYSVRGDGRYGGFIRHDCGRRIWEEHPEEGKCKLHHSISIEARQKKSKEQFEMKNENHPLTLWRKSLETMGQMEAAFLEIQNLCSQVHSDSLIRISEVAERALKLRRSK